MAKAKTTRFFYPEKSGENWSFDVNDKGEFDSTQVHSILLQDIRAELSKMNAVIGCHNAIAIPNILRGIREALAPLGKLHDIHDKLTAPRRAKKRPTNRRTR